MKKKLLSALLALVMVLTLVPATAVTAAPKVCKPTVEQLAGKTLRWFEACEPHEDESMDAVCAATYRQITFRESDDENTLHVDLLYGCCFISEIPEALKGDEYIEVGMWHGQSCWYALRYGDGGTVRLTDTRIVDANMELELLDDQSMRVVKRGDVDSPLVPPVGAVFYFDDTPKGSFYQDHIWDEGTVTKEPTATEPGEIVHVCTVCGATKTEELPPVPTASWQQDSHGWWYRNADGSYPKSCWQQIDGKWYHFDASGYMQTDWLKDGGKWYYLSGSGDMVTGWKEISGKWYFFNDGGDMATGWKEISGKWYYFNGGGDMVTGWKQIGSKWYWFTGSGDMVTGWKEISGKWYFFNGGGDMATGWKQIGSKWYYFNAGGDMVTGWKQVGSMWYYFTGSGDMVTGMQDIGGKRYFFNAGGDMVTGWKQLLSAWFYFDASGAAATGWKQIGSHWYYFNEHGAMQVSRWIGDYYVKADGTMAVNEWVDFGRYYVGPDGKWTGQTRPANQTDTVYWTPGAEVYHTHRDCPTLSRSVNIQSGTVEEANQAGKDRLCDVCANMG